MQQWTGDEHTYLDDLHEISLGEAAAPREAIRQLAQLAHRALVGSGLRTRDLGALFVSVTPAYPERANLVADAVASQLAFSNHDCVAFGGPLAFYESMLCAGSSIRARRFTHVLLLHVAASPVKTRLYAGLMGATRGSLRYLGLGFGRVAEGVELRESAAAELCARLAIDEPRPAVVHWAGDDDDDGVVLVEHLMDGDRPAARSIVGVRAHDRWAACAFELVEPRAPRPEASGSSVASHLARARVGQFPVSFARLDVGVQGAGSSAGLVGQELEAQLKCVVRAFDDVRRLAEHSFLIAFPRANGAALDRLRARLESAVRGLDPAGEMQFRIECRGVACEEPGSARAAEIERSLGIATG